MKKLIIWITIFLITAFIVIAFIASRNNSTLNPGEKDFAFTDTASITKIFLADKSDNSVLLVKQDSGLWKLNETLVAQPEMVRELLRTIMYVSVKSPVSRSMHNTVISWMSANSTKVEIYAKVYTIDFLGIKLWPREKLVRTYYVGDNSQDNTGTFMLMKDADMAFICHIPGFKGFLQTRYSPLQKDWRDHGVFRYSIPDITSLSIDYPDFPERSFVLNNPDNENFEVVNSVMGKIVNLDTIRVINYMNAFTDVRYETILTDMEDVKRDSLMRIKPFTIIEVRDRNNNIQKISLIRIQLPEGSTNIMGDPIEFDQERLFGVLNDNEIVIAQYFVFGPLMQEYFYFLKGDKATDEGSEEFQTIF